MTTTTLPATAKQYTFLNSLQSERGLELTRDGLTRREASRMIDDVKAVRRPRVNADVAPESAVSGELTFGVYRVESKVYRVYPARSGGHLLAALIVAGTDGERTTFEYAGAARRVVKADQRLTLDEAAAFGLQFNVCCVCGRLLTDPTSVERGIGPVCADAY